MGDTQGTLGGDLVLARLGDYPGAAGVKRMADEIASLRARVAVLEGENDRLRHECTSMWRGGVSNTVAIVDRVRNAFAKGLRLKKNVRLAHFDAELDIALGEWFDITRSARPRSYNESEVVFRQALNTTPSTGEEG